MEESKKNWFIKHKIVTVILVLLVLGTVGSLVSPSNPPSNSSQTSQSQEAPPNESGNDTEPTVAEENPQPDVPTEYKSALNKATSYANNMNMSKKGVYDQLVSQYGEKFTAEAAQYAIDNVQADWNANALAKAKTYQVDMNMSPAAIHGQLTSAYGEKFTESEADYAIEHLND